ncbi:DNA polymerase theta [Lycorma delicatula]|uniref:DNA polymerase theta n=1 Tax=Lycorma delicatula TaxID=130591 RepID=UPI003F513CB0
MSEGNSSLTSQERLKLSSWGLPNSILKKYAEKGVETMFQWQLECLCSPGVLTGGNLIYSAPTSAGKTLVAEILAIKTILERRKKVFFILPFVSVVREKMLYFKELFGNCGVKVHGFMGSHSPPGGFKTTNLAVCTIEKANGLINRLIEDHELEEVGCVIVDELHLLGDPHRGYLLELLLAKIKYVSCKEGGIRVQVIGMSATLPNLNLLAGWLGAALYCSHFRPVPLTEYLKVDSVIYEVSNLKSSSTKLPDYNIKDDPGDVIALCLQTILDGHSVLVFCPTKNWCESLSQQIAADIRRIGCGNTELSLQLRTQLNSAAISELLEQLKRCPVGLETALGKCVSFGVAYHHAGLTLDERDILENSFRQCTLRVLVATSTLSSGVNLPARRVIVRSPLFGGRPIDILTYKQMIGRAGRMGKDTAGESFLVCKSSEKQIGEMLVSSHLPSVESCLGLGDLSSSLKRAVLEVIASGVVTSLKDVEIYTACTLFAFSQTANPSDFIEPIKACIEFLQKNEFIRVLKDDQITPTNLGEACLSAALPPDQAVRLLGELHRARQCFVLDSELHIIYQVTPFSVSEQWRQLDWMSALSLWENLSASMQRVGELVGVEERFLVRAIRGNINTNSSAQMEKLSIFRRFYTALALQDLVNEMPLVTVAQKYKCSKGMLQSLQQSASTFAGMVTQFCRRLGWSSLELLVSQFAERLQFGVQRELLDLLRIDCISAIQARALFNLDIQNLPQLAVSKITDVEKALRKAVPFESEKTCSSEAASGRCVWLAGKAGLTEREAASFIINEARSFIQVELGLKTVNWSNDSSIQLISEENDNKTSVSIDKDSLALSNGTTLDTTFSHSSEKISFNDDVLAKKYTQPDETNAYHILDIKVNENDFLVKSSPKIINELSGNVNPNNLNEHKSTNQKCNSHRSSLDIFESSGDESNSSFDQKNTKFQDLICSLSLYETKVSKICIEDIDSADECNEEISAEKLIKVNNKKSIENDSNTVLKYGCCSNSMLIKKETNLNIEKHVVQSEVNTESKGILSNICFEDWDSVVVNGGSNFVVEDESIHLNKNKYLTDNSNNIKLTKDDLKILEGLPSLKDSISPLPTVTGLNTKTSAVTCDLTHVLCDRKELNITSRTTENFRDNVDKIYVTNNTTGTAKVINLMISDIALMENIKDIPSSNVLTSTPVISNSIVKLDKDLDPNEIKCRDKNKLSMLNTDNTMLKDFKISTPTASPFSTSSSSSFSKADSIDFFDSSPVNSYCNNSCDKLSIALSRHSLEDVDVNWGGDSILQSSMVLLAVDARIKRKHSLVSDSDEDIVLSSCKRIKKCDNSLVAEGEECYVTDSPLIKNINSYCSTKMDLVDQNYLLKKISVDKNADIFIDSPVILKKNNNNIFFDTLNIDSQICNVLDNATIINNEQILNYNDSKFKSSQKINTVTSVDRKNNSALNESGLKNVKNKIQAEIMSVVEETLMNELKVTNSVLETAAAFRSTFNFNEVNKEHFTEIEYKSSTPSKSFVKNEEGTKNLNCKKIEKKSGQIASIKSDLRKQTNKIVTCVNLNDDINNEDEDVISSSQEQSDLSTTRISTRSAVSVQIKDCNQVINSSVSHSQTITAEDICVNFSKLETLRKMLSRKNVVSLSLHIVKKSENDREGIGTRILARRNLQNEREGDFLFGASVILGMAVYWGAAKVFYLDMRRSDCPCVQIIRDFLLRNSVTVIMYDLKNQIKLLRQCCQFKVKCQGSDPIIADWLLLPNERKKSIKQMLKVNNVKCPVVNDDRTFLKETVEIWNLNCYFQSKLKHAHLLNAFKDIEMPIQLCLCNMEISGFGFDKDYAELLWDRIEIRMAELLESAYKIAGRKFNPRSKTDLNKIQKYLANGVNEDYQEQEILPGILEKWRKLNSLKTRSLSPLLLETGDRLFGDCITTTITGRVSMHEPNLQNIPKDVLIDDEVFSMRTAFVPSPGNLLVSADYCQLELRILAHFSEDEALLQAFHSASDIFTSIASNWYNIPESKVTGEIRQHAKQICYGLIYGMGTSTLAEQMKLSEKDAKEMMDSFKAAYPTLQTYLKSCITHCRETKEVHTLSNRVRFLLDIVSSNSSLRSQAERQAINTKIQGSAADISKKGMLKVQASLEKYCPGAQLVLQLHDELIYEVPKNYFEMAIQIIKREMENAWQLRIPLPVKVKAGPSWGQLEVLKMENIM